MAARLTYLEIPAVDVAKTARFYGAVCGREIEQRAEGDFRFSDDAARLARLRDPSGNVLGIWQFVEPRHG